MHDHQIRRRESVFAYDADNSERNVLKRMHIHSPSRTALSSCIEGEERLAIADWFGVSSLNWRRSVVAAAAMAGLPDL